MVCSAPHLRCRVLSFCLFISDMVFACVKLCIILVQSFSSCTIPTCIALRMQLWFEFICRCVHAFLRIWDGLSGAGRHRHPPNTLCGHTGELPLWKFSTGRDLEVEYQVEYSRVYMDFTLQYRFIDMGELL